MKKLMFGVMLTLASAGTAADDMIPDDVALVSADDSPYTRMCLAATESWSELERVSVEEGLPALALEEIECNGKPLMQFAREYAQNSRADAGYLSLVSVDVSAQALR